MRAHVDLIHGTHICVYNGIISLYILTIQAVVTSLRRSHSSFYTSTFLSRKFNFFLNYFSLSIFLKYKWWFMQQFIIKEKSLTSKHSVNWKRKTKIFWSSQSRESFVRLNDFGQSDCWDVSSARSSAATSRYEQISQFLFTNISEFGLSKIQKFTF